MRHLLSSPLTSFDQKVTNKDYKAAYGSLNSPAERMDRINGTIYNTCKSISCTIIYGVFAAGVSAQVDCSTMPDGAYGFGCRSYTRCIGGEGTVIECAPEYAFNPDTGMCQP